MWSVHLLMYSSHTNMRIQVESGQVIDAQSIEFEDFKYNGFSVQVRACEGKVYTCIVHVSPSHPIVQSVLRDERVLIVTNMPILTTPASNQHYNAMLLFVKNRNKLADVNAELIRPHADTRLGLRYSVSCKEKHDDVDDVRLSREDGLYEIRALHIHENELYYKNFRLVDTLGHPAVTTHISQVSIY